MTTTLEALRRLAAGRGPAYRAFGICAYLRETADTRPPELDEAFQRWPEYSGSLDYPVPSMRPDMTPSEAYNHYPDVWVGEYGEARLRLVDFLIGECERGALS